MTIADAKVYLMTLFSDLSGKKTDWVEDINPH
jgi:hypothetical protein